MASSNAHQVLQKSLRSDAPKQQGVKIMNVAGTELLEMINERAMNHAQALAAHKRHALQSRNTEHVDKMLQGMSPEDAREFAFQAREQISYLAGVNSRVQTAMDKAKDLFVTDEAKSDSSDPKIWVEESRRMLNRKMFLYNESCEERQKQLSAFCDWFEVYQNIWPLPLVGSEAQYASFLGTRSKETELIEESKIQHLWPQISKMKDDLTHIMSVTSEMGQKALGLEVRKEMKRLNVVIRDCQDQIEDGKKKLEHEKKIVLSKEAELVKHRHMHETALNSRNEVIKVLTDEKNNLIEEARVLVNQHRLQLEDLRLIYEKTLSQYQTQIKDLSRSHEVQKKEIADSFEARIRNFYQQIDELHVKISELESSLKKGQAEIKSRNEEIFLLSKKLNDANARIENLQDEVSSLQDQLKAERESPYVKKVVKERDDLLLQNSTLRAKIDGLEVSLAALTKTSQSARQLLAEKDEEIQALKLRSQQSESRTEQIIHEYEAVCVTRERQATEISKYVKEIDSKNEKISQFEHELKGSNAKSAKLSEEAAFLSAMAENLKADLDEQTSKNDKILTYLQSLQSELTREREQFKQELDDANTRNSDELAKLNAEVEGLREYKASRLSVNFSQKETQTAELQESQLSTDTPDLEYVTAQKISNRLSTLRGKVSNIRIVFDQEVSFLKGIVKKAISPDSQEGHGSVDKELQNRDYDLKDLNRFMEVNITTLSELENVLEGVDAYLGSPLSLEPQQPAKANQFSQQMSPQSFRKMDLHVVEHNFDFSRIHKLQPLPLSPHDIRVANAKSQPVPIESTIPIRDDSFKILEQRQFFESFATPMKNLHVNSETSRKSEEYPSPHVQSTESTMIHRFIDSKSIDSSVKAPWPASYIVPRALLEEAEAKDPTRRLDSKPNGFSPPNFPAPPLSPSDSFRSNVNDTAASTGYTQNSPVLPRTSKLSQKSFEPGPKLNQRKSQTLIHDFVRGGLDKKEFEALESSDGFAKVEIFRETSHSSPYSPASSKNRTSSAGGTRAGSTSRLSNNITRPHSRATDSASRGGSHSRSVDVFPIPMNRSNSGADMLTSYHYLSNLSQWDGYSSSDTKNESIQTANKEAKGPYAEIESSESCFQGFKPSRMLKVLPHNEFDVKPKNLEMSEPPGIEVVNVISGGEVLPILQTSNALRKADMAKKRPPGGQPGFVNGEASASAWLKVQGVQPISKVKTFASGA